MKSFTLSRFLFMICIWWSIAITSTIDDNIIHEQQTTHQGTTIRQKDDLNATKPNIINMTSDTVNYSHDFFYSKDLQKVCHAQVNEFIWKCPSSSSSSSEEKIFKFRTTEDEINQNLLIWYLQSINEIDIIEMDNRTLNHQIQFYVKMNEQKISLSRLYPTYPKISGFEILQFITNLAFQCKFFIDIHDASDVSTIYTALYGKGYYEYHFKGINLNQNFRFKKIVVREKSFLDCFEENIRSHHVETGGSVFESLPQMFYENIETCENAFVPVEFCPITFKTHFIFYKESIQTCINWSSIGGYQGITKPFHRFDITFEDIVRIMKKRKQTSNNVNFVKINWKMDTQIIKTYAEIKAQIFDTSFLMNLFSRIFKDCFFNLQKQKSNQCWSEPNPEDIFKLYLRPCVIPNINLFLKYYTIV